MEIRNELPGKFVSGTLRPAPGVDFLADQARKAEREEDAPVDW